MGVHACVSWRRGGEASLQERATQPGSLGLGAGSGIPTLLLSHADYGTRYCARERKAKGDLEGCQEPQAGSQAQEQPSHRGLPPAGSPGNPGMRTGHTAQL